MAGLPAAAFPDNTPPVSTSPFALCPKCGCQFEDMRLYSLAQVAAVFGVSERTAKWWARTGQIKFRLYKMRANFTTRVVTSADLREFMNAKLPYYDEKSDHPACKQWTKARFAGQRGAEKSLPARRAKYEARRAARRAQIAAKQAQIAAKQAETWRFRALEEEKKGACPAVEAQGTPDAGQGAGGVGFVEDDSVLEDKACSSKTMV